MPIEQRREGDVALVTLDAPPVNAFGLPLRRALVAAFARLAADPDVRAVVVHGAGKGFSAGGDRSEFGTPAASERPTLSRDVLNAVESCGKPVVAAIHGFAVGGGLEFALACDARIAAADARIGLPEVAIGRFPLSGSQRLPRLLGIERAAAWMLGAVTMSAAAADASPIFDDLVERAEDLLAASIDLARAAVESPRTPVRYRPFPDADPQAALRGIRDRLDPATQTTAQRTLLRALQAAVDAPDFQSGLDRAQVLFDELVG